MGCGPGVAAPAAEPLISVARKILDRRARATARLVSVDQPQAALQVGHIAHGPNLDVSAVQGSSAREAAGARGLRLGHCASGQPNGMRRILGPVQPPSAPKPPRDVAQSCAPPRHLLATYDTRNDRVPHHYHAVLSFSLF